MSYEMRRPGPFHIDAFMRSMDMQLREETRRCARRSLPTGWHRMIRALRAVLRPIAQGGAMVLTSVAIIVAVGVAPASLPGTPPVAAELAVPTARSEFIVADVSASSLHTVVIEIAAEPGEEEAVDRPDTVRLNLE